MVVGLMDKRSAFSWYSRNGYHHSEKDHGDHHHHDQKDDLHYVLGEAAGGQDQGPHDGEDLLAHEVIDEESGVVQIQLGQDNRTLAHTLRNFSNASLFLKS